MNEYLPVNVRVIAKINTYSRSLHIQIYILINLIDKCAYRIL